MVKKGEESPGVLLRSETLTAWLAVGLRLMARCQIDTAVPKYGGGNAIIPLKAPAARFRSVALAPKSQTGALVLGSFKE